MQSLPKSWSCLGAEQQDPTALNLSGRQWITPRG